MSTEREGMTRPLDLEAIRERHAGPGSLFAGLQAHYDRGALLEEVERLRRIIEASAINQKTHRQPTGRWVAAYKREPQSEALEALRQIGVYGINETALASQIATIRAALTRTPPQQGRVIEGWVPNLHMPGAPDCYEVHMERDSDNRWTRATLHIHEPSEENDG